ncbi:MAG: MBL fold metallo-hydrolase [Clostridia bacterium]|nr:MBL fold metallo-hydrolase [Clostridia bacterium]
MEIISLPTVGFASNCFIVHNGKEAFVLDPSISEKTILKNLAERGLVLKGILLTHGHFDHIWRAQELRDETGVPLYVHELDAEMLTDADKNAYRTFTGNDFTIEKADVLLHDGDTISLGDEVITVMHTPGHTKGSVCYDTGDSLLTGDTIFAQGFGRYDLYGGDVNALKTSIQKLTKMAETENRWIFCGHGESSTLRQATERLKYYF